MREEAQSDLMGRLKREESTAWYELIMIYESPLLEYVRRLTHRSAESHVNCPEDIVQETFVKFIGAVQSGTQIDSIDRYLRRIAHNEWASANRKSLADKRRANKLTASNSDSDPLSMVADPETNTSLLNLVTSELLKSIRHLLAEDRYAILRLYFVDGLTFAEIANRQDTSTSTAFNRWRKALNELAHELES